MKAGINPSRANDSAHVESVKAQCIMTRNLKAAHIIGSLSAQDKAGMLDGSSDGLSGDAGSWSSSDAPPLLLSPIQAEFIREIVYCSKDVPFCLKNLL